MINAINEWSQTMTDLEYSLKYQGVEVSKVLSLKRAQLLTRENVDRYIKTEDARKIAFALMEENDSSLSEDSEKSVFHALDSL